MTDPLLERRRETRLRRFGLGVGVLFALASHVAVLLWPEARFEPLLERARVRRVMTVEPYRAPSPRARTPARQGDGERPSVPTTVPNEAPRALLPAEAGATVAASAPVGLTSSGSPRAGAGAGDESGSQALRAPQAAEAVALPPAEETKKPDEWAAVLAQLERRQRELEEEKEQHRRETRLRDAAAAAAEASAAREGGDHLREGFLDPRIRLAVVSYPPTAVEAEPPLIEYPEVRVRESQLQAGICRVYYRVWVDGGGRVRRTELKTPADAAARKRYAMFIDVVVEAAARAWYEPKEAEVHFDVLFEVE